MVKTATQQVSTAMTQRGKNVRRGKNGTNMKNKEKPFLEITALLCELFIKLSGSIWFNGVSLVEVDVGSTKFRCKRKFFSRSLFNNSTAENLIFVNQTLHLFPI